jgi:hypothetical protein
MSKPKKIGKKDARQVISEVDGVILLGLERVEEEGEFILKTVVYEMSELELATSILSFLNDNPVILNAIKKYFTKGDDNPGTLLGASPINRSH